MLGKERAATNFHSCPLKGVSSSIDSKFSKAMRLAQKDPLTLAPNSDFEHLALRWRPKWDHYS